MAAQIVAIGCAILLAHKASGAIRAWLTSQQAQYATHPEASTDLAILLNFVKVINTFIAFILVSIAYRIATISTGPGTNCTHGHYFVALTTTATHRRMKNPFWARILAIAISDWPPSILSISSTPGFVFCNVLIFSRPCHFSLLHVQRGFFLLLALYWVSEKPANTFPFLADY